MYQIFQLSDGHPIILYLENSTVIMYSIASGRIQNMGNIFTDVKSDFKIFPSILTVSYLSLENQLVIAKLENMTFKKIYTLPLNNNNIKNTMFNYITINDCLHIFYLCSNEDLHFIKLITVSNFVKDISLLKVDSTIENIHAFTRDSNIYITLFYKNKYQYVLLNEKTEIVKNDEFNLNIMNSLKEKDYEINTLKGIQSSITKQYNELADYAGKLQEEARKLRFDN